MKNIKTLIYHPAKRYLAHYYLKILKLLGCEVIGITGSAGKTTTKEMIASVLKTKYKVAYSLANIDPVYNIPNTILKTPLWTKKLVLEMGVEFPREMNFYIWLANPDVGVLTNVTWTHTQFFKNIEGVAAEKSKLIKSLPKNGLAILNKDDARVAKLAHKTNAKVIYFGSGEKNKVHATDIKFTKNLTTSFILHVGKEKTEVTLAVLGRHFVDLALAAAAVGNNSKIPLQKIREGLENFKSEPHRIHPHVLKNGTLILDDTYNANPEAVLRAIDVLKEVGKSKKTILVLGEMKELGSYAKSGHILVGNYAKKQKIAKLLSLGKETLYTVDAFGKGGKYFKSKREIVKELRSLKTPHTILIKGSRSMGMEEIVKTLIS